jgi:hypothetical protein
MRGAISPLPNTPSWSGIYLKHRVTIRKLLLKIRILLYKLKVAKLVEKFLAFMEAVSSLPCLKEAATETYLEPEKCITHPEIFPLHHPFPRGFLTKIHLALLVA